MKGITIFIVSILVNELAWKLMDYNDVIGFIILLASYASIIVGLLLAIGWEESVQNRLKSLEDKVTNGQNKNIL